METQEYNIIDIIYPVGSIYMSVNDSNPSTLFPNTTWEKIEGKFLLGSNSSHALGSTGGEETHTLTINEMPSHTHIQNQHSHQVIGSLTGGLSSGEYLRAGAGSSKNSKYTDNTTATNQNTGGGNAHNNMPPYLTVNIWKRTN